MTKQSSCVEDSRLTRQLSLAIKEPMTHGGARPGAGRPRKKDSERAFIAHRARPSLRKDHPVHVTLRAMRNVPSLRSDLLERIVKRALVAQRAALMEKGTKSFQLVDFTVQEDHLHLIVEATDKRALARGVAGLEVRVVRRINAVLKRKGSLWSGRYHRLDLRTPTEVRNALHPCAPELAETSPGPGRSRVRGPALVGEFVRRLRAAACHLRRARALACCHASNVALPRRMAKTRPARSGRRPRCAVDAASSAALERRAV